MAGNLTSQRLYGIEGALALLGGFAVETLAGAKTLDATYGNFIKFDPDGSARDVTLPAESGNKGLWFWIVNAAGGAENLVVKDDGGNTIATANQNESVIVFCDGSAWSLFAVVAIALS